MNEIDNKYLIFELDEAYALALKYVVEIIERTEITRMPETPDYIAGVINLRGHVVPVIDVRMRIGTPAGEDVRQRCIVIAKIGEDLLGLLVDNVVDLVDILPENLALSPQVGATEANAFIRAIGLQDEKMYFVVDADLLVYDQDQHFVSSQREGAEVEGAQVAGE